MALLGSLTDPFNGPDTAKWRNVIGIGSGSGPVYGATNGRWRVSGMVFNDNVRRISQNVYDASADASGIYFRLWRGTSHDFGLYLYDAAGKGVYLSVSGGGSLAGGGITAVASDAPTLSQTGGGGTFNSAWEWLKVQYDAPNNRWNFYYATTSGSGPGTWTKFTTFASAGNFNHASGTDLTQLYVQIYMRASASGSVMELDGLNATLEAPPSGNPSFSWSDDFHDVDQVTSWNAPALTGTDLTSTAGVRLGAGSNLLALTTNAGTGRVTLSSLATFDLTSGAPTVTTKWQRGTKGTTLAIGFAAHDNVLAIAEAVLRNSASTTPVTTRRAVDTNGAAYYSGNTTYDPTGHLWVRIAYFGTLFNNFGGFSISCAPDVNGAPGSFTALGSVPVPPGMDVRAVRLVAYADNASVGATEVGTFTPFNVLTTYHETYLDGVYTLFEEAAIDRRIFVPFSANSLGTVALASNALALTPAAGGLPNTGLTLAYSATLRSRRLVFHVPHPANNNTLPRIRVRDAAGYGLEFRVTQTQFSHYTISGATSAALTGTAAGLTTVTTSHPYFSLTWNGTGFDLDTSADGVTWTSRATIARGSFDTSKAFIDAWATVDVSAATVAVERIGSPPVTSTALLLRHRRRLAS